MSSTNTTPRSSEAVDDQLVVDDLVVAVHGRLEGPHHPGQRLDRHLDAGAEAAGRGEQHLVDGSDRRSEAIGTARRLASLGAHVSGAVAPVAWPCPRLESSLSRPDRRPRGPARAGRRDRRASTARCRATSSSTSCWSTSPSVDARGRPGRARAAASRCAKRAGEPLGRRGALGPVRPGPHLRQPLRVLLHLPAAAGPAPQPLPEGRRLPAVVPLRELHHPHPLHRGRPRAGRHRAAVAAERAASTPPIPTCGPTCCATAGAPRACAGCGRCSTTASRSTARSWCARASTTARCSTTPWPACSTSTRSWPRCASCRSA